MTKSINKTARSAIAFAAAAVAMLALAASASAGTITGSTSAYTYNAVAGETNTLTVNVLSSTQVTIEDASATLNESSSTCTKAGSIVTCNVNSSGSSKFTWNLNDGDDYVEDAALVNDTIDGGSGADIMNCGDGADTVSYSSRSSGVRVTPDDGSSNDGELTEFDTVASACEASKGSNGPDILYMANDATSGVMDGGSGDDYIVASKSNASTSCDSSGNPTQLLGQAGNDTLVNSVGGAYLQGYNGNDLLIGGSSCENIFSGYGSDTVYAGDGGSQIWDLYGNSGDTNVFVGGNGSDYIVGSWQGTNTQIVAGDDTADDFTCYSTATDTIIASSWDTHDTSQGDGEGTCDTIVKN